MRKDNRSLTSLFISTKSKVFLIALFSLLLGCLFSENSFAYQIINTSDTSSYTSQHFANTLQGCISTDYRLTSGHSFTGGANFDNHPFACGYRWVNGVLSYWSQSDASAYVQHNFNDDTYQNAGFKNWSINNNERLFHTVLSGLTVKFDDLPYSGWGWTTPLLADNSVHTRSEMLVVYSFSTSSYKHYTNLIPVIGGDFYVYDKNGNNITDNMVSTMTNGELYRDVINKSMNMRCYSSITNPPTSSLFPPQINRSLFPSQGCVIFFTIPIDDSIYFSFPDGITLTSPNPNYNWFYYPSLSDSLTDSNATKVPTYAFTGLTATLYSDDSGSNYYKLSNEALQIVIPETTEEYDAMSNYSGMWGANYSSYMNGSYTGSDSDSNIFASWFDVFVINFIFPFKALFTNYSTSQCVDVPIIGGMLQNPNARYCSWWSADVRNVLTPVFTWSAMMILVGFVFSFLKGHSNSIQPDSLTYDTTYTWEWKE